MATTTLIGDSEYPVLSANGRFVVFREYFYPGLDEDTNGSFDIFVQDLVANLVYPISLSSKEVWGNLSSDEPVISSDGRFVVFASDATNLVPGDTNGETDLFRRDRVTGTTTRISLDSKGNQVPANTFSLFYSPSISANGRFVAFRSNAQLAGVPSFDTDIFVRDIKAGTTTIVSVNSSGVQADSSSLSPSISADGRFVAFHSLAQNLVAGDKNSSPYGFDVFVHDRRKKTTICASVNSQGQKGSGVSDYEPVFDSDALDPVMSPDGRYVVFRSSYTNLVPNDTNEVTDIFRHDLQTRTTTRISVSSKGKQANGNSALGYVKSSISPDGRYVVFQSVANNLVPGDTNNAQDVFVRDVVAGITTRVSVNSKGEEPIAGFLGTASYDGTISADGRKIVFISNGRNMSDIFSIVGFDRIYLRDLGPKLLKGTGGKDTLTGSSKDNLLEAKGGNDILLGRSGNDRLVGGDGSDLLIGEKGQDRLIGGSGKDSFRFISREDGSNTITDFRSGKDKIEILADGFGAGLKPDQSIKSSQFVLGSSATKGSHRFIFNSDTNSLFFDPDGEDSKSKVKLATLSSDITLSRSDIFVV